MHANFRSYGSRARFELRESRAAALFREETRRSVRRREERQQGGTGRGRGGGEGNSISARTREFALRCYRLRRRRMREQRRARFSAGPFLGTICTGYSSRFPPFRETRNEFLSSLRSCEKKRKRKRKGKGKGKGRKKGETNFSNSDRRRSIFPSTSMCVRFVVD